ncbi:MAG: metallophosphoesterase [Bdellovibrionota bacterium]
MSFTKIKLVVSDFHLGSGARNADGSLNVLEDFFHDREFIEFLEHYSSGDFEDIEVELIFNGDFFNLLMIDYEEPDPEVVTELVALRRMKKIMDGHKATMNALRYFNSLEGKKLVFVMGNHDPGILFPSVQELIRKYVGESARFFLDAYVFDGVYIEHGNQYEVANAFDRNQYFLTKDLPEPVLNQPWGTHFLVHVINTVKRGKPHFDKVLPFPAYLKWLLLYDRSFFFKVFWMILRFFFISRFRNDPRKNTSFLQTLKILLEAPVFPDLDEAAEKILATREDLHTVIFGHNHRPVHRQFANQKEYINTGTWNEMTHLELDRLGTRLQCTFALISYSDASLKPQVSLKVWNGKHRLHVEQDVA